MTKPEVIFYNTYRSQVEIFPRLTIIYHEDSREIAFEWLFWGLHIKFNKHDDNTD